MRPLPALLPLAAVALPPVGLPLPLAGLRSLAKASPRCWGRAQGTPSGAASLGRLPVRAAGAGRAAGRRDSGSVRSCGDTRAAAGRRPDRRGRGRRPRRARRRGARRGRRRAAQEPRARRLRHQHRPPAGQARRPAAARGGRGCSPRSCARQPGIAPRRRRRARASSTSPSPQGALGQIAVNAVTAGAAYGRTDALAGQRLNLEFVSANPTGPVHLGGTRWAAVGDALGRLLEASGADGDPRVLLQRRRRADRPVRAAACRRPRRAGRCPRTATRATTSTTSPQQVVAAEPGLLDRPDDEQLARLPRAGRRS